MSIIDEQYLDKRSLVLLIMNLVTRLPSSLSFFSLDSLSSALASESLPRIMWFSKFFRKSFFEPRKFGLAKFKREKYSVRSFYRKMRRMKAVNWDSNLAWTGVPVRITLRLTSRAFSAWKVRESEFFSLCPSSQSSSPMLQFARWADSVRRVS